jgi:C1A family cysteine protease
MSLINNDLGWNFNTPSNICPSSTQNKFNDISTIPYKGIFTNKAILTMPVPPSRHISKSAQSALSNITVPSNFSWRKNGQDQIEKGGVRNQMSCGGCWAFSIASVLGDRYALMNQLQSPYPSTSWLISQAETSTPPYNVPGCSGNNVYYFLKWISENKIGAKLENCWPFQVIGKSGLYGGPKLSDGSNMIAPSSLNTQSLSNCCYNCCGNQVQDLSNTLLYFKPENDTSGNFNIKYFGSNIDSTNGKDYTQEDVDRIIKEIQIEILTNGPVTTSFMVYDDFMTYWTKDAPSGKIYNRNPSSSNNINGGHAVVITGWGESNGQKYWEVRNSWGNTGDEGYCKVAFSKIENKDYWIAIDVPIFDGNQYVGGVVSFIPDNINMPTNNNLLVKSSFGNLLQKSRSLLHNNNTNDDGSFQHNIFNFGNIFQNYTYIMIGIIIIILICILAYISIVKRKKQSLADFENQLSNI